MRLFLILLAAGEGKRLKTNVPKPYYLVNNKSLLEHSYSSFKRFNEIKKILIVYNKKHKKYIDKISFKNVLKIEGGKTRRESTYKALKKIRNMKCKNVIIHDSARPQPSYKLIKEIIFKLKKNYAVIPVIKVTDATKRIKKNTIFKNILRNTLRLAQTPQGFNYKKIYDRHKKNKDLIDDDSALFNNTNDKVLAIKGDKTNLKITDIDDLKIFKSLKIKKTFYGIGFDVHELIKGRKLYLGGLKIPNSLGLKGHSDADPVLHSIIDSLLGACNLGDIGTLFSDKNKKYKNIRSTILLKKVIQLIKSYNFFINNIDVNIIAEKPKIKKYSKKMSKLIANICEIDSNKINIKGKTTEKLGLVGKEKAIAAESISSVIKYG